MALTRLPRLLATGVAALVLGATAASCGEQEELGSEQHPAREGLAIDVGGVYYNVGITRELNLKITPDKAYYAGPEAPPGRVLYGVFLKACGIGQRVRTTDRFIVRDNQGNRYLPKRLPTSNPFAYHPRPLSKKECIPQAGSVAQQGPANGAMLLFEFPLQNTENRPLVMEISSTQPRSGAKVSKYVHLDL